MTHLLSAPVALETQSGLDDLPRMAGWSVSCSCGFEARTSLSAMFANMDAVAHVTFMTTDAVVKARASQKRVAARLQEGA